MKVLLTDPIKLEATHVNVACLSSQGASWTSTRYVSTGRSQISSDSSEETEIDFNNDQFIHIHYSLQVIITVDLIVIFCIYMSRSFRHIY